jgi:AraC-like DNA-binding protein
MNEIPPVGLRAWMGSTHGMAHAHRHLDLEINFVLSGVMTYLIGGEVVRLPPRRLCVLWGAVPHQSLRDGDNPATLIWQTTPLEQVWSWKLPESLMRRLWQLGVVVDAQTTRGDLHLMRRWMSDLQSGDEEAIAIILLELEARLRRLARNLAPDEGHEYSAPGLHHEYSQSGAVEALARFVAGHYQEEIGVSEMARAVHLHPNYAMTLFRRHAGMTLHGYLTLQRVAHAQRALATTDQAISRIAVESGFGSVSRFYEAFRQHAGCSPRQFRVKLARTSLEQGEFSAMPK